MKIANLILVALTLSALPAIAEDSYHVELRKFTNNTAACYDPSVYHERSVEVRFDRESNALVASSIVSVVLHPEGGGTWELQCFFEKVTSLGFTTTKGKLGALELVVDENERLDLTILGEKYDLRNLVLTPNWGNSEAFKQYAKERNDWAAREWQQLPAAAADRGSYYKINISVVPANQNQLKISLRPSPYIEFYHFYKADPADAIVPQYLYFPNEANGIKTVSNFQLASGNRIYHDAARSILCEPISTKAFEAELEQGFTPRDIYELHYTESCAPAQNQLRGAK